MAGEDMIMVGQGELRRLHVIQKVLEKVTKQVEAAEILSLSSRQIRRIVRRIRDEGDRGVIHKSRGRPSNRRIPDRIKDRVIRLYRVQYKGFGPTLVSEKLLERGLGFVVRMVGERDLILRSGERKKVLKIAWGCHCPYSQEVTFQKDGETRKKTIFLRSVRVKLRFDPGGLTLMVVKGFAETPMMLLTNVDVGTLGVMRVLEIYLTRWKCEESWRFIKQAYQLEDIRVLNYTGLRKMVVLVQAVFYFVSVELG